jgi:hypothetical protein
LTPVGWEVKAIAAAVGVIGVTLFGVWLHHSIYQSGYDQRANEDQLAVKQQLADNKKKEDSWNNLLAEKDKAHAEELAKLKTDTAAAKFPVMVVRDPSTCASAMPGTHAAETGGAAAGGGVPKSGVVHWNGDVGPAIDLLSRLSDIVAANCRQVNPQNVVPR